MYSYSQVEAALARVHGVPSQALGVFRGRIKHFQKLGIVPTAPGRGRRIEYPLEHLMVWAFCLELVEFGMDPSVILIIWKDRWSQIGPVLLDHGDSQADRWWHFTPTLLGRDPRASHGIPHWFVSDVVTAFSLQSVAALDMPYTQETRERAAGFIARTGLINLSRLRRSVLAALEAETR